MTAKILVVEDEPAVRDMLVFVLTQTEFQVQQAADAAEARQQVASTPPDIILMDWMLPGTSGVELTRELKMDRLTRDIPVILLTARGKRMIRSADWNAVPRITSPSRFPRGNWWRVSR